MKIKINDRVIELPYVPPEVLTEFFGDNRSIVLERPQIKRGGSVHFGAHIGKPLTERLWEDLRERLGCIALNIYGPGFDEQKTLGRMHHPCACVYLDNNFLIRDIELTL